MGNDHSLHPLASPPLRHTFTSYVLRRAALESPHRDTRISPLPSFVQAVHPPDFGKDRLWLQDRAGDVPRPLKP